MSDREATATGRYIYCVTRSPSVKELDVTGIDGLPVSIVAVNGLAVVCSPSEVKRYRLSRQYTVAHEQVIERAMELGTVLPVRFGTVAESEDMIRRKLLGQRNDDLHGLLEKMDGKVEMGVKVLFNADAVYAHIVEHDAAIRTMRDKLADLPPTETHYERIKLGQMVEQALIQRKTEDADWIMEQLQPHAVDSRRNDVYSELMILNASFLVDKAHEPELEKAVNAVDTSFHGVITIKYVGPLPPFNFVDLVISWR